MILVARRADRLGKLAAESRRLRADVLAADLPARRPGGTPDRVAELGLTVDVLVNNAGHVQPGRGRRHGRADAELRLIEVDVAAVVDLCTRFVPGMVARGRGAVLNVASVGAFGPVPWQASYGAAKAFVLSYTEAMAEELKGTGVAAAVVCPGPVRTGFGEAAGIPDAEAEKLLPKFLWEQPDAVARTAVDGLAGGRTGDRARPGEPRRGGAEPARTTLDPVADAGAAATRAATAL